jgi:hypothetical protein
MAEIVAFEEQRVAGFRRQRIGKAVADIETGAMAAAAEAPKCLDRDFGLLRRDGGDVEPGLAQQQFKVGRGRFRPYNPRSRMTVRPG